MNTICTSQNIFISKADAKIVNERENKDEGNLKVGKQGKKETLFLKVPKEWKKPKWGM